MSDVRVRDRSRPAAAGKSARAGYRRKWKPARPEQRVPAARTMGDVFGSQPVRLILPALLVASVALHAAGVLISGRLGAASAAGEPGMAAAENTYLQRVMEKQRAKAVSKRVQQRITMPPPPPEPEAVVERAITESITGDVAKITHGLIDVKLQGELAKYVQASLKDELASAAKDIATGRLSEEEIRELHRKFQAKAHEKTIEWRQDYLIKHQEERAAVSTTEWYEGDVSGTLVNNIYYELFVRPHAAAWGNFFVSRIGAGHGQDTFIVAGRDFGNRMGLFGLLLGGRRHQEEGPDKCWPGPNAEQAGWLKNRLGELCDGASAQYAHNYAPRMSLEQLVRQYAAAFCPHRADDVNKLVEELKAARAGADAAADAYAAAATATQAAQQAALESVKKLAAVANGVGAFGLPKRGDAGYYEIDRAARTEVLRGDFRQEVYRTWIDTLVDGLSPMIRDFARSQFKKGIIVHKDGVEQAMKEFPNTVVPLLRRDMQKIIPERRFYDMLHQPYLHSSPVTGQPGPPSDKDAAAEAELLAKVEAAPDAKAFCEARRAAVKEQARQAVAALSEEIMTRVLTGNLLYRSMGTFVEGVDYTDPMQEKLTAREMAMKGRGQDLAKLTADGVPDTSAPLVALMLGASKGHGANLEPAETTLWPAVAPIDGPEQALSPAEPQLPPAPTPWGVKQEQAAVQPTFANSPRFEGIPFLTRFPRLDGDLSDWGRLRPLMLKPVGPVGEPVLVYAAWNYQGFFFGYRVRQDAERFYFPSLWQQTANHNTGEVWYLRVQGVDWAFRGDYLRLMFDTLDARNDNRGEPHTQEFVVFPLGTESDPNLPGIERVIESQRDAQAKDYRGVKASCKLFDAQPPLEAGPDGSGPYRAARADSQGYCMEVFIPRSLFRQPIFAPGWYVGFDCAIGMGAQPGNNQFRGQVWATGRADMPHHWGDLLLLGTDPQIVVQDAGSAGTPATRLLPGASYLVTVVDPDRNVRASTKDTVLLSAEVNDGDGDVEVFILNETGPNTGVFRGYVNTQPGVGRQVQGVLEMMPLQQVRLGYVDWANAKGQRNLVYEVRLPVVAGVGLAQP